ncbi:MAG TPA: hypothetical protein VN281_22525 [Verrucomicrobiae bacterium]|nr:hypothetical protein [Verrucomicrobiae bacterium]
MKALLLLGLSAGVSFAIIDIFVDRGAFLTHFGQTWVSHFAKAKSLEYGSPQDHPFEWIVLLRNWDVTVPALLGVAFALRQVRKGFVALLPIAWLGLMFCIFTIHRPWWSYYYVHMAIPLCWCAAIGLIEVWNRLNSWGRWRMLPIAPCVVLIGWMSARVYLEIRSVRESARIYSSPVIGLMKRFKPFTQWLYTEEPVYSFHCGIPLPPDLGVVMLKRFWSGEMTNDKINAELMAVEPGMILLSTDTNLRPYSALIAAQYRMVYQDPAHRLYVHNSIADKVDL